MECKVVRELLPFFADELLGENTTALIKEHLNNCAECGQELELLTSDAGLITPKVEENDLPEGIDAKVVETIVNKKKSSRLFTKLVAGGAIWGLISPAAIADPFLPTKILANIPRFIAAQTMRIIPGPMTTKAYILWNQLDFFTWYVGAVIIGAMLLGTTGYLLMKTKPFPRKGLAAFLGLGILTLGLWYGATYLVYLDKVEAVTTFKEKIEEIWMPNYGLPDRGNIRGENVDKLVKAIKKSKMVEQPRNRTGEKEQVIMFRLSDGSNYVAFYAPERKTLYLENRYVYMLTPEFAKAVEEIQERRVRHGNKK